MKKTYTKPEISFESFLMSTNIAGDCEKKTNLPSNTTCGMKLEGLGVVFTTTMNGCTGYKVEMEMENAQLNGVCYHVPNPDNNLFNS